MSKSDELKTRIQAAVERFHEKDLKEIAKLSGHRKKNQKPEKEVEKACLEWMRIKRWSVQIVESKATYNPHAGRYVSQSTKAGTVDCFGTLPDGVSCFIEFKAPGKLSTFANPKNYRQKEYCLEKINTHAFVCVTDSVERLEKVHRAWEMKRLLDKEDAKNFLLEQLP